VGNPPKQKTAIVDLRVSIKAVLGSKVGPSRADRYSKWSDITIINGPFFDGVINWLSGVISGKFIGGYNSIYNWLGPTMHVQRKFAVAEFPWFIYTFTLTLF